MGRLIDADRLKEVFSRNVVGGNAYFDLIDNAPTVQAIPKEQYEVRLKADLVAMLNDIQIQFEEKGCKNMRDCWWLIEEKINALKADQEGKE